MMYGTLTVTFPFVSEGHPAADEKRKNRYYIYDSKFTDLYFAALQRELMAAAQDEELCITAVYLEGHFDLAGASRIEQLKNVIRTHFKLSDDCIWAQEAVQSRDSEKNLNSAATEAPHAGTASAAVGSGYAQPVRDSSSELLPGTAGTDFQLGCGMNAISRFPEGACINTDDLFLYLSHPDEIEQIARPLIQEP
ncbi:MAG: hypothetical protein IKF06_01535 [Lachnospiraceae bacterium]|nr:hypothetical protein [Lachnospiraceae bacterium]